MLMSSQLVRPITQLPPSPPSESHGSKTPLFHKPTSISFRRPEPTPEFDNTHVFILDKPANSASYASILDSCKCPQFGKEIHAHTLKTGFHGHEFVGTKLLQMYGRCGCLEEAINLFEELPVRNLYSWAAILNVHVDDGQCEEAFSLFLELHFEGISLQFFVFPILFRICSGLGTLELGRQFHGIAIKYQFCANIYVGNALIDMYGKCGSLDDATNVLTNMKEKDCVSWNSIITACADNGRVYEALHCLSRMTLDKLTPNLVTWSAVLGGFSQNGYDEEAVELLFRMQAAGFKPNAQTLASVLPACARLQRICLGKQIHGYITRHGFMYNPYLMNGLVDMYRRCADMRSAFNIFSNFLTKNTVSYNTMIVGYFENGDVLKAKKIFDQMESTGVERDLVSWNSMISGYTDNFLLDEALGMYQQLLIEGIEPDSFTLGSVLTACAGMPSLRRGKEIHSHATARGLQSNTFVGGALVEMYCRCQDLQAAQMAFDEVSERDLATWNILISGYTRCNQIEKIQNFLQKMRGDGFEPNEYTWNGIISGCVENNHFDLAMQLFSQMQTSNLRPDIYTIGTILRACSKLATIDRGKHVHAHAIRCGFDSDVYIGAALVDMYAKCGSLEHALRAYSRISNANLVSHNAMLTAYAMHGHGEEGIAFFRRRLECGSRPDHVTFLSVLSSCVHAGSIETGHEFFDLMGFYDVRPTLKHFTCMVDLLSRAGQLNKAYEFAENLPMEPDSVLWGSLFGGCVVHGNVELGEIVAEKLIGLEPNNTGNYVMLANLYAYARKWNYVARTRKLIKDKGMHKDPGCSWIEDRDEIHVFLASDKSHRRAKEIYYTLNTLISHMETEFSTTSL